MTAILFQLRLGSGYSSGDRGRYRVSIQTDSGPGHRPSGRSLTSFVWEPDNRGGVRRFRFPRPATLRAGRIYHVVFKNIHPRPDNNYISVNEAYTYEPLAPRHPRFRDGIYAVLNGARATGSDRRWSVDSHHMPNMDLVFANGKHVGMAYLGAMIYDWAPIGGSRMARERFTVRQKSRRVTGACVRVGRQRGNGPIVMTLETAAGRRLTSTRAAASRVSTTTPGRDSDNGDWVCGDFGDSTLLRKGQSLRAPSLGRL